MRDYGSRVREIRYSTLAGFAIIAILGTATIIAAQTIDTGTTTTSLITSSDAISATSSDASTTSEIATSTAVAMSTTTPEMTTNSPQATPLTCTMAYTSDLYDTPSGHAAPEAKVIGTQSWTDCNDGHGNTYEFKLTPDEYAALSAPNAKMPQKTTEDSHRIILPSLTSTPTNSATISVDDTAIGSPTHVSISHIDNPASATAVDTPMVDSSSTSNPITSSSTNTNQVAPDTGPSTDASSSLNAVVNTASTTAQ